LTTLGFGSILLIIGLIITGTGGIWTIVRSSRRRRRRERTEEASPSSSSGVSLEKGVMINNNRQEDGGGGEEEDYRFTPKKVLFYCIIVGLASGTLSILIDWLIVLSMAAFVFASITIWYMFGDKLHRWQEKRRGERYHLR
jgi:hypothetical protein